MSWNTISVAQVLAEGGFSQDEKDTLTTAAGTGANLTDLLTSVINSVRGMIEAGNFPLDIAGTIPDSLRQDVIAKVRWTWLIAFPNLTQLQTDARKAAAELAEKRLDEIATGKRAVEAPEDEEDDDIAQGGNWGSEPKIQMRSHNTSQDA